MVTISDKTKFTPQNTPHVSLRHRRFEIIRVLLQEMFTKYYVCSSQRHYALKAIPSLRA